MLPAMTRTFLRHYGTLMAIQHAGMFPAMLVAMLLRRDEYSGHRHGIATGAS